MKAPKKLYVDVHDNLNDSFLYGFAEKRSGEDIEYIRTDAFIEKAEKYFTDNFIKDVSVLCAGIVSINFDIAISNFINYMKGE